MMQRKIALLTPLILVLLFSFTAGGYAQNQEAYRYLKDLSYLTKDRRNTQEKAEDFIKAIQRGDRRAFQVVEYDVLLTVIVRLKKEADDELKTKSPSEVGFLKGFLRQMGEDLERNRATVVRATLPGIFNLDPRVRLVAASWLRILRPDVTMMRAVKLAVGVDVSVIRYDAAKDDFVFTHPRILETVASWEEYYREKELDYPSVFAPGAVETLAVGDGQHPERIGGQGANGPHIANTLNRDANASGDPINSDTVVTGLDARRWGAPNVYDQKRKWEKQLPLLGQPAAESANPVSMADYYQRLNAALKIAYSGLEVGQMMPNGKKYVPTDIYDQDTLAIDRNNNKIPDQVEADLAVANSKSLNGKFPGNTIILKPIASGSVEDEINSRDGLEATADNKDVYRYYPDMTENGTSLSTLPAEMRNKMQLLLGQNWQQGTRVPLGQGRMYVYVNAFGEMVVGNPWVELTKLDMFITRFTWYAKIKSGYKNALAFISKDTFATMFLSIDGETPDVIPFLSTAGPTPMFDYKDVPVLLEGLLKNKVVSNRYVIMRALKDIYEQAPPRAPLCPPDVKRKINIALWETKRDNMRKDIDTGKIFHRESITVGKAPARPTYVPPLEKNPDGSGSTNARAVATDLDPYGPLGASVETRRDRTLDLGFARPNDEVLANSNRAIVSDWHNHPSTAAVEPNAALDPKVAYSLDKLFKQRFYVLSGPDNQVRDYYQHREDYTRLWRDNNMALMRVDSVPASPGTTVWGGIADAKLAINPETRYVEPVPAGGKLNDSLLSSSFGKKDSAALAGTITPDVTFWEAARYIDSLITFNIDRMSRAQGLINDILNGNRRSFMEAKWEDVESMVILTLKRLETIHRYVLPATDKEDPTLVLNEENTPKKNTNKPELTFFDVFQSLKVIESYSDTDARLFAKDVNNKQIQIRRKKEFVPIFTQVKDIKKNTFSEEKRKSIIEASLGGIFNKDPRIRLTAIHFLRTLGPDETMLADIEKARNIAAQANATVTPAETDDYRSAFIDTHTYRRFGNETSNINTIADYLVLDMHKYEGAVDQDVEERARGFNEYVSYVDTLPNTAKYKMSIPHPRYDPHHNEFSRIIYLPAPGATNQPRPARFYGFYQLKAPAEELEKLYMMIRRNQLVRSIKQGDVNTIRKMSRSEFNILSEAIDNEWRGYIPFQSFHADADRYLPGQRTPSDLAIFTGKDIRVIKAGIDNSNFLVQKGTAEFLNRFYNFYDRCTDFRNRATVAGCSDGNGYEPNGPYKKEIRDAMYYYIQDDIVVQEFELAFNGENPDGRAVIRAGSDLSMHLNPGGERVYLSLPERIRKDIRDAVWGDYERLPEELQHILGIISTRAPRDNVINYYNVTLGLEPHVPTGDAGDQLSIE